LSILEGNAEKLKGKGPLEVESLYEGEGRATETFWIPACAGVTSFPHETTPYVDAFG
jgi:hypothetical protein